MWYHSPKVTFKSQFILTSWIEHDVVTPFFIDICTVSQDIIIDINAGSGYRAGKTFVKESEMIIINIIIRIQIIYKSQ
jgi:hypothetical protein